MMLTWPFIALLSALFSSARYLLIKDKLSHHPPEVVVFATRFGGALFLLPFLVVNGIEVAEPTVFFPVMAFTVVSTAIAVTVQVRLLQTDEITRSVPFLSFVPVFMVPFGAAMLGELPGVWAGAGIVITSLGAYIINLRAGDTLTAPFAATLRNTTSRAMLLIAVTLAINTLCDKIAIAAAAPFTYIVLWTIASSAVMAVVALVRSSAGAVGAAMRDPYVIVQSLCWIGGYSSQMFAIQAAFGVESGTTYVKALQLLNILITVVVGGRMFRERDMRRKIAATILMVGGAVLVIVMA